MISFSMCFACKYVWLCLWCYYPLKLIVCCFISLSLSFFLQLGGHNGGNGMWNATGEHWGDPGRLADTLTNNNQVCIQVGHVRVLVCLCACVHTLVCVCGHVRKLVCACCSMYICTSLICSWKNTGILHCIQYS